MRISYNLSNGSLIYVVISWSQQITWLICDAMLPNVPCPYLSHSPPTNDPPNKYGPGQAGRVCAEPDSGLLHWTWTLRTSSVEPAGQIKPSLLKSLWWIHQWPPRRDLSPACLLRGRNKLVQQWDWRMQAEWVCGCVCQCVCWLLQLKDKMMLKRNATSERTGPCVRRSFGCATMFVI